MKYIDGFRNKDAAKVVTERIHTLASKLQARHDKVRIMEVCGTHTMAIGRYGIRQLLPSNVDLISGPGCPVCVTDQGYLDAAIYLAKKSVIIATFGDMLKVPGSDTDLAHCRSQGADIQVCYSPLDALDLAQNHPEREVVFLGIGFETTIGPVVSLVDLAKERGLRNISILTAFKTVIPAMRALASSPDVKIDAYLCPAHVSAIIGANAYEPIAEEYKMPCVVAGFEPLDILLGLEGILKQIEAGKAFVENQYDRVVRPQGNQKALAVMHRLLREVDAPWRGIGIIPGSGLALRGEYQEYDAEMRHKIKIEPSKKRSACRCGEVLKGLIKPPQCALFGKECNPQHAVGPCMVSSEGSCAAYLKYGC